LAADCILPEEENNEENVQGDEFGREIPDRPAQEKKQKKQEHPGVRSEEIK
jgi:hypothetical protein